MDLSNIIEVVELRDKNKVNEYLGNGWVLISTGFVEGEFPGYEYFSCLLGKPRG